jgi:hypothetical protein
MDQAKRNFVNAVLRRESGAVISPSEFENAHVQYFPVPGDSEKVLAQKKANRELVKNQFIRSAGRAYQPYDEMGTPENSENNIDLSSISDEELLRIAQGG